MLASPQATYAQTPGTIWAWGYNGYGELGDGTNTNRYTPVPVSGLGGVTAIAGGMYHSLALKSDGTVWAWGDNRFGQLGDSTYTNRSTPVVTGMSSGTAIAGGGFHSLALRSHGTVWAWGWNIHGQLGDGTTRTKWIPDLVPPLYGAVAVAAGYNHSLALNSDGTVWAWGCNTSGQLGDGSYRDQWTCVAVTGLSGVAAISAGWAHSLALVSPPANSPPTANARPDQSVRPNTLVTLDGSGSSDPDGNYPLSYLWTMESKPQGSGASLSDPAIPNPSFTADLSGDYRLSLTVTDSLGSPSAPDQVLISTYNTKPVAAAGPDQSIIEVGSTVQLNGTQSYDEDGDTFSFQWSMIQRPTGSAAVLSSLSFPSPTFIADRQGDYVIRLVVTDQYGAVSDADTVQISFSNVKPLAYAGGNQAVAVGDTVKLDGGGSSDANHDPLTYRWSIASTPSGSAAALTDPNAQQTSFVADVAGPYIVSLVVNDGFVDSDPSSVTVTAISTQDQITELLTASIRMVNSLWPNDFKNANMKHALTNKINAALQLIDQRLYGDALDKLQNDILQKMDGCAKAGAPDKNDWIINCSAQSLVYPLIVQAINLLKNI